MVCVKWQEQGTHLVTRKNPRTEHKVDQGKAEDPELQLGKWMKMVHSQPVAKPGRSFGPEAWGKASSAAHWRPGSVLFPQQGSCRLLLHDGTVPRTGPGTRRVSVKASTRCRPNEARKALSHFRPASAAVPENSPPTLHSQTCPVGGAVVKNRPPVNLRTGQLRRRRGKHSLRTAHQGSPYPQNRGGAPAYGLEGGGGLRDQQSSRVASSCPCRPTVAAPTPRSSSGGGAGGPRSGRREDVRALL